jgi:hypothetical protein
MNPAVQNATPEERSRIMAAIGATKSERKAKASRENGKDGGRPRLPRCKKCRNHIVRCAACKAGSRLVADLAANTPPTMAG